MVYAKIQNGEVSVYPYSIAQLKLDNPNTSFPSPISENVLERFDVYPVTIERPDYTVRTQKLVEDTTPTLVDDVWTLNYNVVNKTEEETQAYDDLYAESNRNKRGDLLAETDWWALPDSPTMTDAQTAYRQALRDITTHSNWPHLEDSDWPTKP